MIKPIGYYKYLHQISNFYRYQKIFIDLGCFKDLSGTYLGYLKFETSRNFQDLIFHINIISLKSRYVPIPCIASACCGISWKRLERRNVEKYISTFIFYILQRYKSLLSVITTYLIKLL